MSSSDFKQELLRLGHVLDRYEEDLNIFNQQPKRRRIRSRRKRKPYWYDQEHDIAQQQELPHEPCIPFDNRKKPFVCYRCGNEGHIAIGCRVILDHSRKAYNFQQIGAEDRTYASYQQQASKESPGLLGSPNEVSVKINDITTSALLDTESTVSTVSETFYNRYLQDQIIQPLDLIIKIECADGKDMPYLGYITASIELPGAATNGSRHRCLFLVVPDSNYNREVPLLLGTNILKEIMEDVKLRFGSKFLQDVNLHTNWYFTFRCLLLREKELQKRSNRLGLVKSAEGKTIKILPNRDVIIQGYTDHELPYHTVCAMLQPTEKADIPTDLDVAPTLLSYSYRNNGTIPVHISNVTTRTVTISPNAILCEIQPVSVADIEIDAELEDDPTHQVTMPTNLSDVQLQQGKDLIQQFRDVFSKSDIDIGHSTALISWMKDLSSRDIATE
ncbi:uncharacterized protein LOC143054750 [Mytilus galloprovincialis]|uniref:uncharacterized protein LOC143054750 n=1 Tax=Mytilus galloprovincialis TaxID=29158 RepID=UPI003F7B3EE3